MSNVAEQVQTKQRIMTDLLEVQCMIDVDFYRLVRYYENNKEQFSTEQEAIATRNIEELRNERNKISTDIMNLLHEIQELIKGEL